MHYIRSVKKRPVSVLFHHCKEAKQLTDVILLNCNVEVVVYGLGQVTKQRIYIVPNIIDRVIGIYGEHKVSAWGVYDADITCIADNTVRGGDIAMFVRNKRAVWNSALDQ